MILSCFDIVRFPENTSPDLRDVLVRLLTRDAAKRIAISEFSCIWWLTHLTMTNMCMYLSICVCIYVYTHMHTHIYVYTFITKSL